MFGSGATMDDGLVVHLRFRRDRYLLEVDFVARPGVTVLVGPSGTGKSTTLDLLAGHLIPQEGLVALRGEVLVGLTPGPRLLPQIFVQPHRRRIGYVQQGQALFPHLDVAGNLRYGEFALPRAERRRRFEQVAEELGLTGLLLRRPDELSGGERQRVALGRAVLPRPLLLLLDEPLSAVDAASRQTLSRAFTDLAGGLGVPVLHVTHGPVAAPRERTVVYRALGDEDADGGRVVRAAVEAD